VIVSDETNEQRAIAHRLADRVDAKAATPNRWEERADELHRAQLAELEDVRRHRAELERLESQRVAAERNRAEAEVEREAARLALQRADTENAVAYRDGFLRAARSQTRSWRRIAAALEAIAATAGK
jgi:hypothetical protein